MKWFVWAPENTVAGMPKGYGQYCPLAKAIDIVGERWTPLVLRELLMGGRRFNEIRRGVPLMSPALLTKRLKDLERGGVISRVPVPGKRTHEYQLTPAGEALRPIIVGLAVWGLQWVEARLGDEDLDASVLMWEVRGQIDTAALPEGRTVIQFSFPDAPRMASLWWLVIEDGETDLCQSDPGHEVDLYLETSLRTMTEVWLGHILFEKAIRDGAIELFGNRVLERSIGSWLRLSKVYEAAQAGDGSS